MVSGLPLTGDHPMHPFRIDKQANVYGDVGSATNSCQSRMPNDGSVAAITQTIDGGVPKAKEHSGAMPPRGARGSSRPMSPRWQTTCGRSDTETHDES